MNRRLVSISWLLLVLLGIPGSSSAGPYDVILANSTDLTLCQGCGITPAGLGYALIVNTGVSDITLADLADAKFTVSASRPEITMLPFLNIPSPTIVGSIHPGEAMGSIIEGNTLLLPYLNSGEVLRNLAGLQFMTYQVNRGDSVYEGPVDFDVRMSMAGYEARYTIHAEVHLGQPGITYLGATRTSAVPSKVVDVSVAIQPRTLHLPSRGRWIQVTLEPAPPYLASDISVGSLRLNGSVPVDPSAPVKIRGGGRGGSQELTVRFRRGQVAQSLNAGNPVEITVSGSIGGQPFESVDFIKVTGRRRSTIAEE